MCHYYELPIHVDLWIIEAEILVDSIRITWFCCVYLKHFINAPHSLRNCSTKYFIKNLLLIEKINICLMGSLPVFNTFKSYIIIFIRYILRI